jgi:anthranilate phosphoribosyltransferase
MTGGIFAELLRRVAERQDLTREEAAQALRELVGGDVADTQAAALLMGMRVKGETPDEIAGLVDAMRSLSVPVITPSPESLLDIVGTGGDHLNTFNISTAAALVVAGAGVKVAKHGNRAASSRCGSADVLEALGVRIDLGPEGVAACIETVGIGFMLASVYHPAAGKVAPIRRALGIRTVFNFLGPLINPAGAKRLLMGVSAPDYLEVLGEALARGGCERALLVCGHDGMDELCVTGATTMVEVAAGAVGGRTTVEPETFGLERRDVRELAGDSPRESAELLRKVLGGMGGAPRDAVLLNAAAALYVAGVATSIESSMEYARVSIDHGDALRTLDHLVDFSNRLER